MGTGIPEFRWSKVQSHTADSKRRVRLAAGRTDPRQTQTRRFFVIVKVVVAALRTALTAAKAVLKDEGAAQADLDKAIDDIGRAVGKLELLPEKVNPEEPKPDTPKEPVKTGDGFMAAEVAGASVVFALAGGAVLFLKKRKHI